MNAVTERKTDSKALINIIKDKKASIDKRLSSVGDLATYWGPRIFQALPKGVTADRIVKTFMFAIRKTPKLLECDPMSLFQSLTEAATYGWEIGGVLGHAYLVPFGSECVLIPGYKGLIDLCRRSGQVSTIDMQCVHLGDSFEYVMGDDAAIIHKPNRRDPERATKPIEYVYAIVKLRDGGIQRSVWSREEIDAHKERYSQGWKSGERYRLECLQKGWTPSDDKLGPWFTAWPSQAKKTVLRGMFNSGLVPLSAEYRDIANRDEESLTLDAIRGVDFSDLDGEQGKIEGPVEADGDIAAELAKCNSLTDVTDTKARFRDRIPEDQLEPLCEAKRNEIRSTRGEKAKQGTLV